MVAAVRWSATTTKLDAAVVRVQGEMSAARKDATNPHYNRRYADLASIVDACQGPCATHGIARYQFPWTCDRGVVVTTRLACEGEWCECDLVIPVDKRSAQAVGSAITYGKRYGLAAILGIVTTDDDGEGAEPSSPEPWRSAAATRDLGPRCSGPKAGQIATAIKERIANLSDRDNVSKASVFRAALTRSGIDLRKYGESPNEPGQLTVEDGRAIKALLGKWLEGTGQ